MSDPKNDFHSYELTKSQEFLIRISLLFIPGVYLILLFGTFGPIGFFFYYMNSVLGKSAIRNGILSNWNGECGICLLAWFTHGIVPLRSV